MSLSIVGRRGEPVFSQRNLSDVETNEIDLGAISMNGDTFDFRVYNNFNNTFAGIPKAINFKLNILASPKRGHTILLNDSLAVQGKCTYSAKLAADPVESFHVFPMDNVDYDEIGNGEYNQYQVKLDGTQLTDDQKTILNGIEWKLHIVVVADSGGLELVQP